jgi:hypothetical protein
LNFIKRSIRTLFLYLLPGSLKTPAAAFEKAASRAVLVLTFSCLLLGIGSPAARAEDGQEFAGTINGKLKVHMVLDKTKGEMNGSYYYEHIGKPIRIVGSRGVSDFYLNEFAPDGHATALFKGAFVTDDWIEGFWSSVKEPKKKMPFTLQKVNGLAVPAYPLEDKFSGQYRLEKKFKDKSTVSLHVWMLKDGRLRVFGELERPDVKKPGFILTSSVNGVFSPDGEKVSFNNWDSEVGACKFTMVFNGGRITVSDADRPCNLADIEFGGEYRKTGQPRP